MLCMLRWYGHLLHEWQDLVGGLIAALALVLTVKWTLEREKRRHDADTKALRIALGAEVRQQASSALTSCRTLLLRVELESVAALGLNGERVAAICALPDPIVYSSGADKLGSIGEMEAFNVVYFYGQLAVVAADVRRAYEERKRLLDRSAILDIAAAQLKAMDAALKALPAFKASAWSELDEGLIKQTAEAHRTLDHLRQQKPMPGE